MSLSELERKLYDTCGQYLKFCEPQTAMWSVVSEVCSKLQVLSNKRDKEIVWEIKFDTAIGRNSIKVFVITIKEDFTFRASFYLKGNGIPLKTQNFESFQQAKEWLTKNAQ